MTTEQREVSYFVALMALGFAVSAAVDWKLAFGYVAGSVMITVASEVTK